MRLRVILAILLSFQAAAAWAVDCSAAGSSPATAAEAQHAIRGLATDDCLGGNACKTGLCIRVDEWEGKPTPAGTASLFQAIRASAVKQAGTPQDDVAKLIAEIDAIASTFAGHADAPIDKNVWRIDGFTIFRGTRHAINFYARLAAPCAAGATACAEAFRQSVEIATDANLVNRIISTMNDDRRDEYVAYVASLKQRWDDYFDQAPTQYPWELAINSAIYRKQEHRGFNEPPAFRWIVAHPTAGYEYVSGDDSHFKGTVSLEAIGGFRGQLGASAAVAWADHEHASQTGYGVVLHWKGTVTAGVMRHSGASNAIFLSLNLDRWISKPTAAAIKERFGVVLP